MLKNKKNLVNIGGIIRYAGCVSLGLLMLLAILAISPSIESDIYATCLDGVGNEECAVNALSQEIGITTKTAITLATASQVKLPDVVPTSAGVTSYASTKLAISTNSKEGYSIFLQTGTADGNLIGVTSGMDSTSKISNTTKTGATLNNLETDSYGYALSTTTINDSTTYNHVPTSSTVIYSKSSNAEMGAGTGDYPYGDEYYLAFGTKIGTTLPAGTYSGTVTVSAVANPITVTSLYDISTMQEMSPSICENTKEHYTKQLIDSRDGKSYWVAKLKDGNCWMTQNLALDLSTNKALTPEDSDVSQDWTPKESTNAHSLNYNEFNEEAFDYNSWNLGKTIISTPLAARSYEDSCILASEALGYTNGFFTISPGIACREYGLIDVSNSKWQPTFTSQLGIIDGESYSLISANENNFTYDSHYLLGNYYQFSAATAGSLNSPYSNNAIAPYSICPKGWQLPNSGVTDSFKPLNIEKSFYNLLLAYGYPSSNDWNNLQTLVLDSGRNSEANLLAPPMYFVASGDISVIDNEFYGTNIMVEVWDNAIIKTSSAQLPRASKLYVNVEGAKIYISTEQYNSAFNIRCVAR